MDSFMMSAATVLKCGYRPLVALIRSKDLSLRAKDLFVGAKHGLPAKLRHREPVFIAGRPPRSRCLPPSWRSARRIDRDRQAQGTLWFSHPARGNWREAALLPPPTFRERRHRGLARRPVAVRRASSFFYCRRWRAKHPKYPALRRCRGSQRVKGFR